LIFGKMGKRAWGMGHGEEELSINECSRTYATRPATRFAWFAWFACSKSLFEKGMVICLHGFEYVCQAG